MAEALTMTAKTSGTAGRVVTALLRSVDGPGRNALLRDAGSFMARTVVPQRFAAAGSAWGGQTWAPVVRGGRPLWKTGGLVASMAYTVDGNTLIVGSAKPQARLDNRGGPLAGQHPSRERERAAHEHYKSFNPRAKSGSVGWMYVLERAFLYWGDAALNAIKARWERRISAQVKAMAV